MARSSLEGRSILIVEDQPLIVMDITQEFEGTGAALTTTNTLKHALLLVEHDGLSGAILDHALGDGDSSLLCERLNERGVPFMIYSGHTIVEGPCKDALHISKPAASGVLVAAMERLIMSDAIAKIEIETLPEGQRRSADGYHELEQVVDDLEASLASTRFDPSANAETEASIESHTAEMKRLGRKALGLEEVSKGDGKRER